VDDKLKVFVFSICGFLGQMMGGWSESLKTLVILMIVDYVTGTIVAVCYNKSPKTKNGRPSSKESLKGILKKFGMLSIVVVAYRLEVFTNLGLIKDFAILGLIGTELISLKENWDCMDIKVPDAITEVIVKLTKQNKGEDNENHNNN